MLEGFDPVPTRVGDIKIHAVRAGSGPPLLLLHGHPQTHVIWHRVAPVLARRFTVVAADLRGYGDSDKPDGLEDHRNYSKREMAADQVALMRALGFETFALVGHDRGGRVGARLALDHPDVVTRLVTLDIAPTLSMYEQTSFAFARAYWHWFFLVRPAPVPETLIRADPRLYLEQALGGRARRAIGDAAFDEYLRCLTLPNAAHALCEDYRAAIGVDLEHDRDTLRRGELIRCPLLALWGSEGIIARCFEPLAEWRRFARQVSGSALPCGHYIPEEAPDALLAQLREFLIDPS